MDSATETLSARSAVSRETISTRFFRISYLAAITVSTIGWVSAFGWAIVRLAKWCAA
jgi:hypothetical protein